jgi:nucleotide-binding universal stress UspA family protein
MNRKLLVATDFSPYALNAWAYACQLAEHLQASLQVVHAHLPLTPVAVAAAEAEAAIAARAAGDPEPLYRLLRHRVARSTLQAVDMHFHLQEAAPVAGILHLAERISPLLVVAGAKGRSTDQRKLLGHKVQAIVREGTFPVLVIPEGASFLQFRRILFASSAGIEDMWALDPLRKVAAACQAEIDCLYVSRAHQPNFEPLLTRLNERYRNTLTRDALTFRQLVHPDLLQGLEQYLQQHPADVLALHARQGGLFEQAFTRRPSIYLKNLSQLPMMVFHR